MAVNTEYRYPVIIFGLYKAPTMTAFIEISGHRSSLSYEFIQYGIRNKFEESVSKASLEKYIYTSKYFHISLADASLVKSGAKSIKDVSCTPLDVIVGPAGLGLALDGRCLVLIAHEPPAEEEDEEGGSSSSAKGSSKKRGKKQ
jgi:hypothetical protein